jgi:hypothetical protein
MKVGTTGKASGVRGNVFVSTTSHRANSESSKAYIYQYQDLNGLGARRHTPSARDGVRSVYLESMSVP